MADRSWKALLAEARWLQVNGWAERIPPVMTRLADRARASQPALRVILDAVVAGGQPGLLAPFAMALVTPGAGADAARRAALHLGKQERWPEALVFHELLTDGHRDALPGDLLAHARCLGRLGQGHRTGALLERLAAATAARPPLLRDIVDAIAASDPGWMAAYGNALAHEDPDLLAHAARRLERNGHWSALGMALALLHRTRATPWRTVAAQMSRLREHGGGTAADRLVPLVAETALAKRHAYKVVLDTVTAAADDDTVRLFAGEIAAHGLRHFRATARQWIRRGDPRRAAWAMASPPPGTGHDAWRLSLAWLAEEEGDPALADALLDTLRNAPEQQALGPAPTPTASTLLFRNRRLLDALVEAVRARLAVRDRVAIHVAAVSSGAEVYSLAAYLQEHDLLDRCTLEASDYSAELLAEARTGKVDRNALRATDTAAARHFDEGPDGARLEPALLERIRFVRLDLLEPAEDPAWDLFVANNVLVHYPPALQARIVRNIALRLAPGGIACLGGQTNDGIRDALQDNGLVPGTAGAREIYEGWTLQRRAWYQLRRPYWALPPYRPEPGGEWRFATLFTRAG